MCVYACVYVCACVQVQCLESELEEVQRESDSCREELQVRLEEQQQWRLQMDKMADEMQSEGKKLEQCQKQKKNALVGKGWATLEGVWVHIFQ